METELRGTCHFARVNDVVFPAGCSDLFISCSVADIRVWNAALRQELLRIQVNVLTPSPACHPSPPLPSRLFCRTKLEAISRGVHAVFYMLFLFRLLPFCALTPSASEANIAQSIYEVKFFCLLQSSGLPPPHSTPRKLLPPPSLPRFRRLPYDGVPFETQVPNLECYCVGITRSGGTIVSGWSDGKIRAFYPESGKLKFVISDAHAEGATAVALAHDDDTRPPWRFVDRSPCIAVL